MTKTEPKVAIEVTSWELANIILALSDFSKKKVRNAQRSRGLRKRKSVVAIEVADLEELKVKLTQTWTELQGRIKKELPR